jgi:hypothetical protein
MKKTRTLLATLKMVGVEQFAKRAAHASALVLNPRGWRGKLHRPPDIGRPLAASAIEIDPSASFQPDPKLVQSYPRLEDADPANIRRLSPHKLMYQDIPFSKYKDQWHFHPNQIGGYLVLARPLKRAVRTAFRVREFMAELPNGGLALYYPRTLSTERFRTPEFICSGIAQGQLLAGYTRLIVDDTGKNSSAWRDIAARIALSLQFPVERGGVCADGSAILEGPNFRSCPEIILNGWLDALLHLHDYLRVVPDSALLAFFRQNVRTLTELLPYFDCPSERLSRYSNLCPYIFRAHVARQPQHNPPLVRVEYRSREPRHRDYWIPDLRRLGRASGSLYDNRIERSGAGYVDFSISVAGHYDIVIEIAADCAKLSFDPGMTDETSTVPARTFRRQFIASSKPYDGASTQFLIRPVDLGLIAGCPTNFLKPGGQNVYHSYHVAALYELALTTNEAEQRRALVEYADRWLAYIQHPKHKPYADRFVFADPAKFARMINNVRAFRDQRSFEELRAQASAGFA